MKHEKKILPRILALLAVVLLVGLIILSVVVGSNKSVFAESVQSDDSEMVTEESQTVYCLPKGTTFRLMLYTLTHSKDRKGFFSRCIVENVDGYSYWYTCETSSDLIVYGDNSRAKYLNGANPMVTFVDNLYLVPDSSLYNTYVKCIGSSSFLELSEMLTVGNTPTTEDPKVIYYLPKGSFLWSYSAAEKLYNNIGQSSYTFGLPTSSYMVNVLEFDPSNVFTCYTVGWNSYDRKLTKVADKQVITISSDAYFDDVNVYNFLRDCGASPMIMYVDGRNAASKDYAEGYGAGYFSGYESGYNAGRNKGQSEQIVSSPLSLFLQPVSDFMNLKLFGTISLSTVFNIVLFVAIAAIFIKMFAGG